MSSYYETIQGHEVSFHPHSFADSGGRLFRWNGQLYRGLRLDQAPFFLSLFEDGTIQSLVEKNLLIESEIVPFSIEGYTAVVRHRTVPFVSYPQEWCATMLKDATLTLVDLMTELTHRNLVLKDAHPWNLLFDGCEPVYVDLTSITSLQMDCDWPAYEEFCHFCYYPLILMSLGHERIARSLLPEYGGVQRREVLALAQSSPLSAFLLSKLLRRGLKPVCWLFRKQTRAGNARLNFLKALRKDIESISLPSRKRDSDSVEAATTRSGIRPDVLVQKQEAVSRVLSTLRPVSVLDVSTNDGWSSRLMTCAGRRVVSMSTDEGVMTKLYREGRQKRLPILPLVLDFMKPTPSLGYSNHYLLAATERLKCEMVLALSLVQRAVFDYFLPFHLIVEGLASFSTRWVLAEFTPPGERFSGKEKASIFSWYSLENFVEALEKRFSQVEIISRDTDGSVLLLCEK